MGIVVARPPCFRTPRDMSATFVMLGRWALPERSVTLLVLHHLAAVRCVTRDCLSGFWVTLPRRVRGLCGVLCRVGLTLPLSGLQWRLVVFGE